MKLIDKIKAVFNGDEKKAAEWIEAAEKLKVKFMEYKLTDGTLIKVEPELAQGAMAVLADGTPAPDGEHMMEGGVKIRVAGGVIEAVEKEEEMKTDVAAMEAQFKALKSENEALKTEMAEVKATVAGLKFASVEEVNNLKTVVSGVVDALELDGKGKVALKATPKTEQTEEKIPVWKQMAQRYAEA